MWLNSDDLAKLDFNRHPDLFTSTDKRMRSQIRFKSIFDFWLPINKSGHSITVKLGWDHQNLFVITVVRFNQEV